jgi:phenylalanyl-tRNA synthetase beta chain
MIISTSWIADFVQAHATAADLVDRLALSGLNHESTATVGDDTAIEIEVTSNRPDCLGHIGVAREIGVLYKKPLSVPDPWPLEAGGKASASVVVAIESPELCPFYSARVIRGVTIGPSPTWLVERLATVGLASVNNVVDVTSYVMLECGQPLHAFDAGKLAGAKIIVRRARPEEEFLAINHKTYTLDDRMCVIADAERPVALAGVMGGADSEISATTTDVLIESAQFAPLAVRAAARSLVLASASSYRFERGPDPAMVDWASRRAAMIILELAGGVLEKGDVTAGTLAVNPAVIAFASERVAEVLGCEIHPSRQHEILKSLGFHPVDDRGTRWQAPTWRRDCTREIDLVEEIARIEGYHHVPEDMTIAARPVEFSAREQAVRAVGDVLTGLGFCEAMTRSVVDASLASLAGGWTSSSPLVISPPLVRGADRLRQSLLPSLLEARAGNVAVGNTDADLFEVARGYLPKPADADTSSGPVEEPLFVSLVTGGTSGTGSAFFHAKGIAAAVLARLGIAQSEIAYEPVDLGLFAKGRTAEVLLSRPGQAPSRVGFVGEIAPAVLDRFSVPGPVAAVELRLDRLEWAIDRERKLVRHGDFPAVARDINLVVDESMPWAKIEAAIRGAARDVLERCTIAGIWRDADRLGANKKSLVVSLSLRSPSGTLTGDDAGTIVARIITACTDQCAATLRA